MDETFLRAEHIVKRYAAHTALADVSIDVRRGRVFGLLGPNGAGKTTLIRIVNRITMPDEGTVLFDGHPLCAADTARIGYLPEERGLYKKMRVGEQALYLARLRSGLPESEVRRRLTAWFERFGIMEWWDKKLEELSKGMQQKVQFIITVLHEPPLLIFDEPFSGFDPVNAELLKDEILRLRDAGHTVIFSTHNMSSVEEICDDIALINASKVVLSGSVGEIKQQFRTGKYLLTTTSAALPANSALYVVEQTAPARTFGLFRHVLVRHAEASTADVLTYLAPQVEIRGFEEQMPTMQEIFLRTVGGVERS